MTEDATCVRFAALRRGQPRRLGQNREVVIFLGIALGYIIIVETISFAASRFERRWAVR